jgi:translocation and assembly module TamB
VLNINNSKTKIGFELFISNWIPSSYFLDIKTIEEDKIHIIYNIPQIGLGIDGYISGNFNFNLDTNEFNITSELKADDSIINLGSVNNSSSSKSIPLLLNMKLTTGKKVQFIWPSSTLPILLATVDQDRDIYITLDSLNGSYSVIGEVDIKYGTINYFQKSFYLSEGSILFDENESKFDPLLGFKAQIKEVDTEGEIVNISLIQDNLPVSSFAPRFESDPPLSDVEIFSILGTGVFSQIGNEQIDLTSALLLTGDLVTQFAIVRDFETKVRDIFKLDLFSIRTQMIQNILIDRFVDTETAVQELYLDSFGRYLDNTTLYLGKYIGDDIFLQALLQINNQLYLNNDLDVTNKLLVESTISLEWQTPLFLLGLSVKPDFIDPISSIQNTNLELSWGYSY